MTVTRAQLEARGFTARRGDGRRYIIFGHDDGSEVLWDSETLEVWWADRLQWDLEELALLVLELRGILREIGLSVPVIPPATRAKIQALPFPSRAAQVGT